MQWNELLGGVCGGCTQVTAGLVYLNVTPESSEYGEAALVVHI